MSTGLQCMFFEKDHQWYYTLQNWTCPVGIWDWAEDATTYGPFLSYDAARDHLRDNHANPGGHSIVRATEGEKYERLVSEAVAPQQWRQQY